MKSLSRKTFPPGSIVFKEGDIANCAYLLKSGAVEITTYKNGDHVLLTRVKPNQLFGELALIDGAPRSATAITIEGSEVIVVKPEDIRKQLDASDEFMRYWVEYLTERIRDLSQRVED